MIISPLFFVTILLSGGYAGFRIMSGMEAVASAKKAMDTAESSSALWQQLNSAYVQGIIEMIVCALIVICSVICLIRCIRYWISIGLLCFTNRVTRDVLNVTNSIPTAPSPGKSKKKGSSGILPTTNRDDP